MGGSMPTSLSIWGRLVRRSPRGMSRAQPLWAPAFAGALILLQWGAGRPYASGVRFNASASDTVPLPRRAGRG